MISRIESTTDRIDSIGTGRSVFTLTSRRSPFDTSMLVQTVHSGELNSCFAQVKPFEQRVPTTCRLPSMVNRHPRGHTIQVNSSCGFTDYLHAFNTFDCNGYSYHFGTLQPDKRFLCQNSVALFYDDTTRRPRF